MFKAFLPLLSLNQASTKKPVLLKISELCRCTVALFILLKYDQLKKKTIFCLLTLQCDQILKASNKGKTMAFLKYYKKLL